MFKEDFLIEYFIKRGEDFFWGGDGGINFGVLNLSVFKYI